MKAFIECAKGSKQRYEMVDGELKYQFEVKKPFLAAYGYLEKTRQQDGDALDCYVLGKNLEAGKSYDVLALCSIVCYDCGKRDDKLICITRDYDISAFRLDRLVKRLVRTIRKFKKGTVVFGTISGKRLYYEMLKCKVFDELFRGE